MTTMISSESHFLFSGIGDEAKVMTMDNAASSQLNNISVFHWPSFVAELCTFLRKS